MRKTLLGLGTVFTLIILYKLFSFSTYDDAEDLDFHSVFNQNYQIFALSHPKLITFAEETVPLGEFDIKERFDRELLVNTYWQSNILLLIKRSHKYFPVIEPILSKNGVPEDFKYLALVESGFTNIVSPAGARGFWQLMDATAKEYGLEVNDEVDERYHVEKATEAACKYILNAYSKFNSWTLAAASYNVGMHGIERRMEEQKVNSYYDLLLPEETSRYIFRILAAKEIISSPEKYGVHYRKKDLYYHPETKQVMVDSTIANWADFALENGINYKLLKIFNPWLRQPYLNNKSGKSYYIDIPTTITRAPAMVKEEDSLRIRSENPEQVPEN